MASSLFQETSKTPIKNNFTPLQMAMEFKKFISNGITPQKAEAIITEKLQNGSMSLEQFEQLKQQAMQMQNLLSFIK